MPNLEGRIDALETANRRLRLVVAGLAAAVVGLVCLGMAGSGGPTDVVRAKRFEVVNDGGKILAMLDGAGGSGSLGTFDTDGHVLVTLDGIQGPDGRTDGVVTTHSSSGHGLTQLSVAKSGEGMVRTYDGSDGKSLITLGAVHTERGAVGSIATFNKAGKELVEVRGTDNGDGMLMTRNGEGQELVNIAVTAGAENERGKGIVVVLDPSGRTTRSTLSTHP